MKEKEIDEIIKIAKELKEKGKNWHHHLLTPKCCFNTSGKFKIVLENEDSGEAYYCDFPKKPMKKLEVLENLFFDR